MAERVSSNLAMLMRVADRLGPVRDRLVFLGGAVTEFFITERGGPGPRQTKDVDVVIDVVNLGEYSETLREQLVALGDRAAGRRDGRRLETLARMNEAPRRSGVESTSRSGIGPRDSCPHDAAGMRRVFRGYESSARGQ